MTTNEPVYAIKVFANVNTTGRHASMTSVPIHEIPLMQKKLQLVGENLEILADWPAHQLREVALTKTEVLDERVRLERHYIFAPRESEHADLVADFYGSGNKRLVEVMRRIHERFVEIEKKRQEQGIALTAGDLQELARIVDPDSDIDPLDIPITLEAGDDLGNSEVGDDPKGIDGDLVTHIINSQWPEETAVAVARLVAAHGREIPPSAWKSVKGVSTNTDRREAMLKTLEDFYAAPATE